MVSANAHEYAPGGYGANHDAFLTKPVDISVLLETLRTCLKLEWRYHAEPAPVRTHDSMLRAAPAARHHLEDLWQLGMIGHVRGIHAKLRDIESEDPDSAPITTHLRTLVESFEMKRYMEVVKELRADG